MEEEEAAENGSSAMGVPGEEEEIYGKDELKTGLEEGEEISEETMKQMMEEIEELEEELAEDMMSELQDMISCARGDMTKRKHQNDEERQITRADLKYLKALFDRLEQEKKQVSSGNIGQSSGSSESFSCVIDCIPDVEAVDVDVGSFVDACV